MVMAPQKGSPGGAAPPVAANEEAAGVLIPDPGCEGTEEGGRGEEEELPLGSTRGLADVATRTVSIGGKPGHGEGMEGRKKNTREEDGSRASTTQKKEREGGVELATEPPDQS